MSRSGILRSRVAVFVCIALVTSLISPAFSGATPDRPPDSPVRIAVGTCSDGSGAAVPEAAETLERALRKSLADQRGLEVVSLQGGDPQRVLSARIAVLKVEPRRPAEVQVLAECADAATGQLCYRTQVGAQGAVRPGEKQVAQVERALTSAATQIVAQVAQAELSGGHVIGTPRPGVVIVDLGSGGGLTPGSELEVLHDGQIIARARVESVAENTATCRLFDVQAGAQPVPPDAVRVASLATPKAPHKKGGHNNTATIAAFLIGGALLAAVLAGGGGGGGGANQLGLQAADPELPADGTSSTEITATFSDGRGRPLPDGTVVHFQTTLGLIVPGQAPLTDGQCTATLTSGTTAGVATVRADSKGRTATTQVTFVVPGAATQPASLTATAAATELPADGNSTTIITAVAADANNNPVPNGTEVRFTTSLGIVGPGTATTTDGVAIATLRSGTTAGNANVTVRAGALVERVRVRFVDPGSAGNRTIYVTRSPAHIPADGSSTSAIQALVKNADNNPVPDGTLVRFTTTAGTVFPASAQTVDGLANATLRSDPVPARARVTAAVGTQTVGVVVFFDAIAAPAQLTVLTNARELPADGTSTATLTTIAADSRGNPVADGTDVTFTTTLGLITPATAQTTGGIAEAELRSATTAGTATVVVRAGTLRKTIKVEFIAAGGSGRRTLYLTRSQASIPADGASTCTVQATVKNSDNTPVDDGTTVLFTSTAGTVFPARARTTDGIAAATLRSDPQPGQATVTATVGRLTASLTVNFVGGGGSGVASIFLTRDDAEIPGDGVSETAVTATVRDARNNPVADGTPVVFTATRGVVSPALALTDNGQAQATLQSEPTSTDVTATVTAAAGSQQAQTSVKFTGTGGGPTQIQLVADRTNIPADRRSTAALHATLVDDQGQPVVGAAVIFVATAGHLQAPGSSTWTRRVTINTNAVGVADALLRSTADPNTSTVTASAPSVTPDVASVTVAFTSLIIQSVAAEPASVPVGGNRSAKVTATIVDTLGNPAPNGTVVEFSIINQAQLPSATIAQSASTNDGRATAVFRSGTEVGTARIRVYVPTADAANDQTIIGITAGPPALMTVAASAFVTSARDLSEAVDVTALVSDRFDNPVEDGTAVRFDVTPDAGGVITGTAVTQGGFAQAKLYTTGWVGDLSVIASTTGEGGVTVDNRARPLIVHMGGAPVTATILAPNAAAYSPASPLVLYTGADQKIVVQLLDISGGPADPNAEVTFQVDRGTVTPDPAPITAPLAGTATATFNSSQPTPAGTVDRIIAVSETAVSPPLYIEIQVNPAP